MFGKLHLLLLHFPIGLLLLAVGLECAGRWRKRPDWSDLARIALGIGVVAAIFTAAAGWVLAGQGGYEQHLLTWHARLAYVTVSTSLGAWWLRHTRAYFPLLIGSGLAVIGAGHFGGSLTHGEDFLPMPWEAAAPTAVVAAAALTPQSAVYPSVVYPILEKKCVSCHNASKTKGGLRMDDPALFAKGGKHGVAFVAGQPDKSLLLQRALLPLHAEAHMPPAGKAQLTDKEIRLLEWWIQNGASFDKTIADTPQPDDVAAILAVSAGGGVPENPVWQIQVAPVSDEAMQAVKNLRVSVMRKTTDQPWLNVSLTGVEAITPSIMDALGKIGKNVVELDATNTPITDSDLKQLAPKMPHLTRLQLSKTAVSDTGVVALSTLQYLEFVNLSQTRITDASLALLAQLPHLQALYLWRSGVTEEAAMAFQRQRPTLRLQMAGTASALSDTTPIELKPPRLLLGRRVFDDTMLLAIDYPKMVDVFYTLDGASPTTQSIRYDGGSMVVDSNVHIRALAIKEGWKQSPIIEEFLYKQGIKPVDIQLVNPPKKPYTANGGASLCDLIAADNAADGTFLGYQGEDLEAIMDLGVSKPLKKVRVHTFEGLGPWVYAPVAIVVWTSEDKKTWKQCFKKSYPVTKDWAMRVFWVNESMPENTQGRYVKIKLQNVGKNPSWHPNKGKPCWVFADEIVLE
jgi:mono/diheme cytochrome c family protein